FLHHCAGLPTSRHSASRPTRQTPFAASTVFPREFCRPDKIRQAQPLPPPGLSAVREGRTARSHLNYEGGTHMITLSPLNSVFDRMVTLGRSMDSAFGIPVEGTPTGSRNAYWVPAL